MRRKPKPLTKGCSRTILPRWSAKPPNAASKPARQPESNRSAGVHEGLSLRQRGLQSTGTDLLICAVAVRHGLKIFTTDTDFAAYARHLPIKLHLPRAVALR